MTKKYKTKNPVIVKTGAMPRKKTVYRITYKKLFWIFFMGCFMGVLFETLWCLITRHRFESRVGVLYGPFNPVYGIGAVLLTIGLKWIADKRDLWIFLCSMVIGGLFEYICSLLQEIVLGTVSWEYSHTQFNLGGRTNLMYAFLWGILGLLWVKEFYPRLSSLVDRIPNRLNNWLILVLGIFMLFNMAVSLLALARQSQRRMGILPTNAISRFLDRHYTDEFLKKKYPNMMPVGDKGA